jgi:glutamate synthase domain-containing protein 3
MHRDRADEAIVRELTEQHLRYTGSTLALELLDNWEIARKKFVKVFPTEYKRALSEMFVKRAVAASSAAKTEREAA